MLVHRLLLRLCPSSRLKLPFSLPTTVKSAVTFVTVAPSQHRSPPASPTRPLNDKINSRARLLAGHLNATASSSSTAVHTAAKKNIHTMSYTTRKVGAAHTLEHRIFIEKDGKLVSPWHDIPLYANEQQTVLNMVVEVPRWTNAKMEVRTLQLAAKDRFIDRRYRSPRRSSSTPSCRTPRRASSASSATASPTRATSGTTVPSLRCDDTSPISDGTQVLMLLQTWEDPNVVHQETKAKGDNDPLDVCEIGELVAKPGEVIQVKVLGVMALLDEGETDWKIMVINVNDPLAPKLNDVEDVERHLPGLLRATNEWFRIYKIPDGKPENQFAFSGECKNKKYAMDIVRECAEAWEKLATGKTPKDEINLYVEIQLPLTTPINNIAGPTLPSPTLPTAPTPASSTFPRARTRRPLPSTPASTSGSTSLVPRPTSSRRGERNHRGEFPRGGRCTYCCKSYAQGPAWIS
jgi:inorganic pyrophosphatase